MPGKRNYDDGGCCVAGDTLRGAWSQGTLRAVALSRERASAAQSQMESVVARTPVRASSLIHVTRHGHGQYVPRRHGVRRACLHAPHGALGRYRRHFAFPISFGVQLQGAQGPRFGWFWRLGSYMATSPVVSFLGFFAPMSAFWIT